MKNALLKAGVESNLAMHRAADSMMARYKKAKNEEASVVETVIIIGIFVVICVVIGALIFNAVKAQGDKLSNCISGINNFVGGEDTCSG